MKVKSIYIDKLKALKDFYIDFNDNVNILIGENGLGKTTILEAIYFMLTASDINDSENSFDNIKIKTIFEDDEIQDLVKHDYKNKEYMLTKDVTSNESCINTDVFSTIAKDEKWINKVIYLPTGVNFKKYKVDTPKKLKDNCNIGTILNSDEMSINLKEYLVNVHYKDLEDMSIGEKPYRIERFRKLYNSFFDEKEFIGVKDFEPLFKIKSTGEVHSADELSSGEKQIFFRGGSLLEMNLNNAIILIDEPELSLHPEWQQKILDFYKEIGENNQIIIATHSPHIVSSCKKEEVIVLERRNDGKTIVKNDVEETYGWTVEQLLLSVFELKSVRNPKVQQKLDRFKILYINKDTLTGDEIKEFNDLKVELETYLDPEDPSLSLIHIKEDSKKLECLLETLKGNKNA